MSRTGSQLKPEDIKAEALRLGFALVGIAAPEAPKRSKEFLQWLAAGRHASMEYLARPDSIAKRLDAQQNLPGCRSVICIGLSYGNSESSPVESKYGRVAAYACGKDYHMVIPQRLEALAAAIGAESARAFSDSGPVLEHDFAQRAGLGWVGKNTCLIAPGAGSYFLLGELFTDMDLAPDQPFLPDHCGSCRRCIDACPTQAILPDRTVDARRCISYLTIENKGSIPLDLRPGVGSWVFGCDICQQVCPWNRFSNRLPADPALEMRSDNSKVLLTEQLKLTPGEFQSKFVYSPVRRAKRRGYLRNLCVAAGNSRERELVPDLLTLLEHESEGLIRAHAAWAVGQLGGSAAKPGLERAFLRENDESVKIEILLALEQLS